MNIGLIGSGGREHALCKALYNSKKIGKIYCFPGNAGTSELATNIKIDILNFKSVLSQIKYLKIIIKQFLLKSAIIFFIP